MAGAAPVTKTIVAFVGDGQIYQVDTIEHDGMLWLVPRWHECAAAGWRKPERIICVSTMAHQKWGDKHVLNSPIPRDIFDGRAEPKPADGILVIEMPDISLPLPRRDLN
jgi:hypothetical protein